MRSGAVGVRQPAFLEWASRGFTAELVRVRAWNDQAVEARYRGKRPADEAWQSMAVTPALVSEWARLNGANVGVRTRAFPAVDLDVDDPGIAEACADLVVAELGATSVRHRGNSPRRVLLYRLAGEPFRKSKVEFTAPDGTEHKVEFLADGQQVVVAGRHHTGAALEWSPRPPAAAELPELTGAKRDALAAKLRARLVELGCTVKGAAPRPNVLAHVSHDVPTPDDDRDLARQALDRIDPDCPYEEWFRVGMALHSKWPEAGGTGFTLWDGWSARGTKYPGTRELEAKWRGFTPGGGVSFGTLLHMGGVSRPRAEGFRRVAETQSDPVPGVPLVPEPPRSDLADIAIGYLLDAEELRLEEGVNYLPTGFPRLDMALGGGFAVPSLNVLGAGPKSGKSSTAQIIATRHVDRGGAAYYLDVENGRRRVLRQILCRRARLGRKAIAALRDPTSAVFSSREEAVSAAARWAEAKEWLRGLSDRFFLDSRPPTDFEARVRQAREWAGSRDLLVVVDSLQKLPGDLSDRRAVVDAWVRMFERLRHEYEAVFLVVSEIKRGADGAYRAHESAFKESGGIEYAADLALTLSRDTAEEAEGEGDTGSTLRVELARDTDEDPRGDVATYFPVRPFYDVEERDPVPRREKSKGGRPPKAQEAAEAFLRATLARGPELIIDVRRKAKDEGISKDTLRRAGVDLGIKTEGGKWSLR